MATLMESSLFKGKLSPPYLDAGCLLKPAVDGAGAGAGVRWGLGSATGSTVPGTWGGVGAGSLLLGGFRPNMENRITSKVRIYLNITSKIS